MNVRGRSPRTPIGVVLGGWPPTVRGTGAQASAPASVRLPL